MHQAFYAILCLCKPVLWYEAKGLLPCSGGVQDSLSHS